jgi:hypothetical protein
VILFGPMTINDFLMGISDSIFSSNRHFYRFIASMINLTFRSIASRKDEHSTGL